MYVLTTKNVIKLCETPFLKKSDKITIVSSSLLSCKSAEMANLMEDEVFKAFTTYAAIAILKMMLMAPMTAYYRFTRGVGIKFSAIYFC